MLGAFVRTVPQLYGVRFLLGLAEAGYFPEILHFVNCCGFEPCSPSKVEPHNRFNSLFPIPNHEKPC
jgi:hypothetical protein